MARGHHVELVAMVDPLWFVNGEISKMPREPASEGESTEVFEIETRRTMICPDLPDMKTVTDPTILERYRDSWCDIPHRPSRCH